MRYIMSTLTDQKECASPKCEKRIPLAQINRYCTKCTKLQEDNKPENKIKRLEERVAELEKTVISNEELLFHIKDAIKQIQSNSDIYINTKYIDKHKDPSGE